MKAVVCKKFGMPESLVLEDVPIGFMGPDEILVKVNACGINFPDVLIIQDKYQFKPALPFSPGGEVSGIISRVGKNVMNFKPGDHVVALPGWGGLAEYVVVKASRAIAIPSTIDYITAASTLYNFGTSYYALKDRAILTNGEYLLVLGAAGGVGLAAIELGKLMGATVIAAASSPAKLTLCKQKGADYTIDYTLDDLRTRIKEITGDKGVDVVFDPVGGNMSDAALRSTAWQGRYLVVGFASGEIQKIPANLPLLKGCSITGVFWGNFNEREPEASAKNFATLVHWISEGKIHQHIHKVYSFENAPQALSDLMARNVLGKAVVKICE